MLGADLLDGFDPADVRQTQIHQDDVGPVLIV
jgi:hypothetical protein